MDTDRTCNSRYFTTSLAALLGTVKRLAVLAIVVITATVAVTVVTRAADDLDCNQQPGNRFFWIERAFCDLEMAGPGRAEGLIIWNHGILGTTESWKAPAPPALRLLQRRGWDVIMLKRHHLAETQPGGSLDRTVRRTLEEVALRRQAGYKRIALAGQSFGGYVTLEAIDTSPDIDAAIAFAPGVRYGGASGALDPTIIERILDRVRVGRLAIVFPKNDGLFGNIARGERSRPILARRQFPWLLIDETARDVTGHGGATTSLFALRYGACLNDFLAATTLGGGPFACQPATDDVRVVRELLVPPGSEPLRSSVPDDAPAELRALFEPRWTLLDDNVALIGPFEDQGKVRLMYRTSQSGGVYDATIVDGTIRAVLGNKSTLVVSTDDAGTVIWTSADGRRTVKGTLRRLQDP